jgi:hypothetical protein
MADPVEIYNGTNPSDEIVPFLVNTRDETEKERRVRLIEDYAGRLAQGHSANVAYHISHESCDAYTMVQMAIRLADAVIKETND